MSAPKDKWIEAANLLGADPRSVVRCPECEAGTLILVVGRDGKEGLACEWCGARSSFQGTMIFTAWGKDGKACCLVGGDGPQLQDEDTSELIWRIEASSYDEAMQKYYDLQGWGTYKPIPLKGGYFGCG